MPGADDVPRRKGAPRVKICGLRAPDEAQVACEGGARYVGVVFAGRVRRLTTRQAAEVVGGMTGSARAVGVFVDARADDVLRRRDATGFHVAQLHGAEPPEACHALRREGLGVWKALRPTSEAGLRAAWNDYAEAVDAILVEGYAPDAPGGAGASFPHRWLAGLDRARCPLALAGGLTPDNVGRAIAASRPDIVDVSSGVERSPGVKSLDLMRAFLARARGRDAVALANSKVGA